MKVPFFTNDDDDVDSDNIYITVYLITKALLLYKAQSCCLPINLWSTYYAQLTQD